MLLQSLLFLKQRLSKTVESHLRLHEAWLNLGSAENDKRNIVRA
jgi:hypothetical protein